MGNNQSQHHAGDGARSGPGGRVVSGLRSRSSTVNSLASRVTPSSSHGGTGSGGSPSAETAAPDAGDLPIADPKKQVDHGWLDPENHLYRSEYNRGIVHRLIADRKLAPFYLGLQDFEDEWQVDAIVEALDEAEQQATQNLRDAHAAAVEAAHEREAAQISAPTGTRKHKDAIAAYNLSVLHRERLAQMVKQREKRGGGALQKTDKAEHARFYQGNALECPICFLCVSGCFALSDTGLRSLRTARARVQLLSLQHGTHSVLRPAHLYRMLRVHQARGSDADPSRVRTGGVPVLHGDELWMHLCTTSSPGHILPWISPLTLGLPDCSLTVLDRLSHLPRAAYRAPRAILLHRQSARRTRAGRGESRSRTRIRRS